MGLSLGLKPILVGLHGINRFTLWLLVLGLVRGAARIVGLDEVDASNAPGIPLGLYLEHQDINRMTRFRDKSALFGKEKGPDEEPSWGDKEYYWKFSQWKRTWWY